MTNQHMTIGDDFILWSDTGTTRLEGNGRLVIGDRVFINSGARVLAHNYIGIGDDVAVGFESLIVDSDMHGVAGQPVRYDTTLIGAGTWIGARAIVLAGVTIGRRCIAAAGSVVTKDVPDDTLVAGNPARPIRVLEYPSGCTKAWNNDWNPAFWADGGRSPGPDGVTLSDQEPAERRISLVGLVPRAISDAWGVVQGASRHQRG